MKTHQMYTETLISLGIVYTSMAHLDPIISNRLANSLTITTALTANTCTINSPSYCRLVTLMLLVWRGIEPVFKKTALQ